MSGYDPARYAPGTPWATHDWDDTDPFWCDEAWWCRACGIASYKAGATEACTGQEAKGARTRSRAVLVKPKAPDDERVPAAA